jgi:hypothetical protein
MARHPEMHPQPRTSHALQPWKLIILYEREKNGGGGAKKDAAGKSVATPSLTGKQSYNRAEFGLYVSQRYSTIVTKETLAEHTVST